MPEGKFDIDPKDIDTVVNLVKQMAKQFREKEPIGEKVEIQERATDALNQGLKELITKIDESNAEHERVRKEIEEDKGMLHLRQTIEGLEAKFSEEDAKKFKETMGMTEDEFRDKFNTLLQDLLDKMKEVGIGQVKFRDLLFEYSREIKKVTPIAIEKIAEGIKELGMGNEDAANLIDDMKKIKKQFAFETPYKTVPLKSSLEVLGNIRIFAKYEWIRSLISRLRNGWVWLVNMAKKVSDRFESSMSHYGKANSLLEEVLREGTEEPLKKELSKENVWKKLKMAAEGKDKDEIKKGPGGHIPDATGPHGKGEGPGEGKGEGLGMEKKPTEEKDDEKEKIKVGITFDDGMYQLDFDKENAEIILKALKTPEEKIKEVLAEPKETVSVALNLKKKKEEKPPKPASEKKEEEPKKKIKREFPERKPIGEGKTQPIKEFKKDDIWDQLGKASKERGDVK